MTERTPLQQVQQIENVRNALAMFLVTTFVAVLPLLFFKLIPEKNEQLLTYMIGQLSGMATTVLGFYFVNKVGADALDAKRAENSGKLADAVVAATSVATPDAAPATPPLGSLNAVAASQDVADAAQDQADVIAGEKP